MRVQRNTRGQAHQQSRSYKVLYDAVHFRRYLAESRLRQRGRGLRNARGHRTDRGANKLLHKTKISVAARLPTSTYLAHEVATLAKKHI